MRHWRLALGMALASAGAGILVRRRRAPLITAGTIGLAIHDAEVARAEADLLATAQQRSELARIRHRVDAAVGTAARVEADRATVLAGMDIAAALQEMRARARELGL